MDLPPPDLHLDDLLVLKVLGKGAMATVFLVYSPSSDPLACSPFALKVVDKSTLRFKNDTHRRARWEVSVLTRFSGSNAHPFLPRFLGSGETDEFFCWGVPYCPGGDLNVLRYHQTDRVFSPAVIRFYLAEIVCALEHLHENGIAYRDLKPENVLIQHSGHVTLTDFDLCRELKQRTVKTMLYNEHIEPDPPGTRRKHHWNLTRLINAMSNAHSTKGLKKAKSARVSPVSRRNWSFSNGERSNSFVGTEEYVSPEIVRGDGHEFSVDWWALGILSYEMQYGTTPFKGKNRKDTYHNVLHKSPEFVGKRTALTDLIGRLLEKDPRKRLGYNGGACEIKEHLFFNGVKWDLLTEVLSPPFIPSKNDGQLTENLKAGGIDVREYLLNQKAPTCIPPSPVQSPASGYSARKESLMEF